MTVSRMRCAHCVAPLFSLKAPGEVPPTGCTRTASTYSSLPLMWPQGDEPVHAMLLDAAGAGAWLGEVPASWGALVLVLCDANRPNEFCTGSRVPGVAQILRSGHWEAAMSSPRVTRANFPRNTSPAYPSADGASNAAKVMRLDDSNEKSLLDYSGAFGCGVRPVADFTKLVVRALRAALSSALRVSRSQGWRQRATRAPTRAGGTGPDRGPLSTPPALFLPPRERAARAAERPDSRRHIVVEPDGAALLRYAPRSMHAQAHSRLIPFPVPWCPGSCLERRRIQPPAGARRGVHGHRRPDRRPRRAGARRNKLQVSIGANSRVVQLNQLRTSSDRYHVAPRPLRAQR